MLLELVQTLDFLLEKMFSWLLLSVWFVLDQQQRESREIGNQDVIIFYLDRWFWSHLSWRPWRSLSWHYHTSMLKQSLKEGLWQIITELEYRKCMASESHREGFRFGLCQVSASPLQCPSCKGTLTVFASPSSGWRPGAHSGSHSWWWCGWWAFFQPHCCPPNVI